MFTAAIQHYYKFFDETITSSTFIVLMVTCLIFAAGTMGPAANASDYSGNIQWAVKARDNFGTITIDGIEYQINLQKI